MAVINNDVKVPGRDSLDVIIRETSSEDLAMSAMLTLISINTTTQYLYENYFMKDVNPNPDVNNTINILAFDFHADNMIRENNLDALVQMTAASKEHASRWAENKGQYDAKKLAENLINRDYIKSSKDITPYLMIEKLPESFQVLLTNVFLQNMRSLFFNGRIGDVNEHLVKMISDESVLASSRKEIAKKYVAMNIEKKNNSVITRILLDENYTGSVKDLIIDGLSDYADTKSFPVIKDEIIPVLSANNHQMGRLYEGMLHKFSDNGWLPQFMDLMDTNMPSPEFKASLKSYVNSSTGQNSSIAAATLKNYSANVFKAVEKDHSIHNSLSSLESFEKNYISFTTEYNSPDIESLKEAILKDYSSTLLDLVENAKDYYGHLSRIKRMSMVPKSVLSKVKDRISVILTEKENELQVYLRNNNV